MVTWLITTAPWPFAAVRAGASAARLVGDPVAATTTAGCVFVCVALASARVRWLRTRGGGPVTTGRQSPVSVPATSEARESGSYVNARELTQ